MKALITLALAILPMTAQDTTNFPFLGRILRNDPKLDAIAAAYAQVRPASETAAMRSYSG